MAWLIGFVCGVTLCAWQATLPDWRIWLPLAAVMMLWRRFIPCGLRPAWHGALMLITGLAYAAACAEWRMAHALAASWEMKPLTMVGVLRGLPVKTQEGFRILVDIERVETPGAQVPGRVRLMAGKPQDWSAGSRWHMRVKLRAPRATANPYGFDLEPWLWAQGIQASGTVLGTAEKLGDAQDLLAWVDRLRARIAARVARVLGDTRAAALITALTVGEQQGIRREDWRAFSRTGVTHLVSISGLHIGMVAGLVAMLARRCLRRHPPRRLPVRLAVALCALAAAGAYALLAGWSVPTRRTFFMLAVACLLLLWRRALSAFQIWWLALSAVLLLDPFAVFLPGLWLSFGLVAALMLVVCARRRPPNKWRALCLGQWASMVMSLAPLSGFFGALPLVSPLANVLAIPWVSLLLAPLSLLAVVLPLDAPLWLAAWLSESFFLAIEWLARAPVLVMPGMPWTILALALLGSLWLIAPAGMPGRGLAVMLLLPMFSFTAPRPAPGSVWLSVLDVGQGLSVLVRTARHTLLYDTGAMAADSVVLPQLAGRGVSRLDMLMLSHHDSDHDGAASEILQAVPSDALWVGQAASAVGRRATLCASGQQWRWDGVGFEVLAPLAQVPLAGNNPRSCVLRIATTHEAALLAGDIPAEVEATLVARHGARLASTVLLAPHHGSQTSSSALFLRTVAPRWGVISAGYRNRYGHPHASVLERFHAQGAQVARTDLGGALEIRLDEHAVEMSGLRQRSARYWRAR